jgi:hypothetical protein
MINKIHFMRGKMRLTQIEIGSIIAWIIAIILFATKLIDFQIFILFALLKLEITVNFRQ